MAGHSIAIGIDLGTTNSVVSVFRRGESETLKIEGQVTLPSVVSFRPEGEVLVGQAAKKRLMIDPDRTIASVKRCMGDRQKTFVIDGKTYTPVDISCLILRKLKAAAEAALGMPVFDAVITVPAYFTSIQKEDTKQAASEAGFNVLRLEQEPTAAAISYGFLQNKDQTLLVYDLGGGTFDVSILEVKGNKFTCKALGGDQYLGGDDFDQVIVTWAAGKFKAEIGIDLLTETSSAARQARQKLKELAEEAKKELSQAQSAHLTYPDCLGYPLDLILTLQEYNQLISPLVQRTINILRSTLQEAHLSPEDIDRVILVGGSTRNRLVREMVTQEIKEPYTAERVDEVVSHGAAIVAHSASTPDSLMVERMVSQNYGVAVRDSQTKELFFQSIIPKRSIYPCRAGYLGSTGEPMQEVVLIQVFSSQNTDLDQSQKLDELMLPISSPKSEDVAVGAIFEYDADGIIHFTAVDFSPCSAPAVEAAHYYGAMNDWKLDLEAIDALIKKGEVKTAFIKVQTNPG